ncbi:cytochrome P450 [Kitasatospora sp. MAA4]|uniref:cytochrome P450 n=1 Tax=Kitasatospora sp. MAA4 TaxID=3035093 RepID=UPI00247523A2|nr:cytochrome P450 [Kitasatospora sp. MAA4]MDH6132079.1 cytochrome P450 [Kitasatospora sp. MAA4]
MTSSTHEFNRYDDVRAALADPLLVPLPAAPGAESGVAWLRAAVARFSTGAEHARRRALVQAELDRLDPAALRSAAAAGPEGEARLLVVRALAEGLGLPEPDAVAEAVALVARTYFGGEDAEADAAVAWLLPRMFPHHAGADQEAAANRIGLLVQACDATGGLVEHARRAAADCAAPLPLPALLAETLRHDPPVRVIRRVAAGDTKLAEVPIAEGDLVVLDVAAANRDPLHFADPAVFRIERTGPPALTFAGPPRLCPGRDHALALAAGVLERDQLPSTRTEPRTP